VIGLETDLGGRKRKRTRKINMPQSEENDKQQFLNNYAAA